VGPPLAYGAVVAALLALRLAPRGRRGAPAARSAPGA